MFDDIKGPYEDGRMDDATFVREGMAVTGFRGTAAEFEAIVFRDGAHEVVVAVGVAENVGIGALDNERIGPSCRLGGMERER